MMGGGSRSDLVRRFATQNWTGGFIGEHILSTGYLDRRNPLTQHNGRPID